VSNQNNTPQPVHSKTLAEIEKLKEQQMLDQCKPTKRRNELEIQSGVTTRTTISSQSRRECGHQRSLALRREDADGHA
jgi:hypothetical protein